MSVLLSLFVVVMVNAAAFEPSSGHRYDLKEDQRLKQKTNTN